MAAVKTQLKVLEETAFTTQTGGVVKQAEITAIVRGVNAGVSKVTVDRRGQAVGGRPYYMATLVLKADAKADEEIPVFVRARKSSSDAQDAVVEAETQNLFSALQSLVGSAIHAGVTYHNKFTKVVRSDFTMSEKDGRVSFNLSAFQPVA